MAVNDSFKTRIGKQYKAQDKDCDEVKRAKEELGASGVSLASSYDGVYLDDQRFYSIYESAVSLKLPVFVHATTGRPIGSDRVMDPLLTPVIEFLFDLP